MGLLPLQFRDGEGVTNLALNGYEVFDIEGISGGLEPRQEVQVRATDDTGREKSFAVISRLDTPVEIDYYRHGGILQYVLRNMI